MYFSVCLNPLNAELNPIRHLLALVVARHIVHVSRVRVKPVLLGNIILKLVLKELPTKLWFGVNRLGTGRNSGVFCQG